MMQIIIADTGPGIPPEIERTLFEPFVTEGWPDAPRKGSGLGLAVCKHLIQAAGGTITVSTKLGEGTAFTLRLPAATPKQASNEKSLDRGRSSKKAA
jgi:signal transduction histidine kinase